jgi:hypothetical protein
MKHVVLVLLAVTLLLSTFGIGGTGKAVVGAIQQQSQTNGTKEGKQTQATTTTGVPQLMSHQGYVADSVGNPLNGNYAMTFRMYDDSTAGSLVLTQSFPSVFLVKGIFNVNLDVSTVIFASQYWLETEVNGQTLAPRTRLTSAPYSLEPWAINGSDINYNNGNVGIGTNSPQTLLSVGDGSFFNGTPDFPVQTSTGDIGTQRFIGINKNGSYGTYLGYNNAAGRAYAYGCIKQIAADPFIIQVNDGYDAMTFLSNGNVGIGQTNPVAKLDISGAVKIADGTQGSGKVLTSDASGVASWHAPGTFIAFKANTIAIQAIPSSINTVVNFPSVEYNDGSAYNSGTGAFTAPSSGLYHFDVNLSENGVAGGEYLFVMVNGVNKGGTVLCCTTNPLSLNCSVNLKLNVGDIVNVQTYAFAATSTVYAGSPLSNFSGYKVY